MFHKSASPPAAALATSENLLPYDDDRRDPHLRQRHLTLHNSRPGGVRTAASSGSVCQRQEGCVRPAAHALAHERPSARPGDRREWPSDDWVRGYL